LAKEWVLNIALNRWQFNRPKYVGKVSEEIRKCQPKSLEDWIEYYLENVKPAKYIEMKKFISTLTIEEYLNHLGTELCKKIHEVLRKEIEEITDDNCKAYIKQVIFERTYEGYITEKRTVYEYLERDIGAKTNPAPDEWDRKYNVDFYIKAQKGYIGIQVKPITYKQTPEIHNWLNWLRDSHKKFEKEIGGRVFVVFSVKDENGRKLIYNKEIISEIKQAIIDFGGPVEE
jgi:hypothetical protein